VAHAPAADLAALRALAEALLAVAPAVEVVSPDALLLDASAAHLLRGGEPGSRTAVCFQCHAKEQWAGRNPHQEAAQKKTGCTLCHVKQPVWGQDRAGTVSFIADINIICLACHDRGDHPGGVRHTVTLTAAMPAVPELLPLGTGRRITCATCHNPHIDLRGGHELRGIKEPTAFCLRCHKL